MDVGSVSLIVPATLYTALHNSKSGFEDNITTLSQATAVILLILYILYLNFQLRSHASLFKKEREEDEGESLGRTMSRIASGIALVIVIFLIAVCADFSIGSIDSIAKTKHISKTFSGLILLPARQCHRAHESHHRRI
jgi:Ca2+:H+ antiporter